MNYSIIDTEVLLVIMTVVLLVTYFIFRMMHMVKAIRNLNQELQIKRKTITGYSLNIIQKNELILTLSGRIDALKKVSTPDAIQEFNSIQRTLKESTRIDREWENFRASFEAIHVGFIEQLQIFHNLSKTDLKLCALIKLRLNLKETANVLGISPDSVKTARHRLKKKLELPRDENLEEFISRLEKKIAA